ncbi:hypothetical protein [Saccharopolyspora tripterygii]
MADIRRPADRHNALNHETIVKFNELLANCVIYSTALLSEAVAALGGTLHERWPTTRR